MRAIAFVAITTFIIATSIFPFGCAMSTEAAPTYEALVCDPAAADRIAFGVQIAGAHFAARANVPYGRRFLIVDGSCRYYAARYDVDPLAGRGQVRTGMLSPEELSAINAELLTGAWERINGEHRVDILGADASTISLWRDGEGASCYQNCGAGSAELRSMLGVADRWERQLTERGMPMDGPVQLLLDRVYSSPEDAVEWTGVANLEASLVGERGTIRIEEPADYATLRTLRDRPDSVGDAVLLRQGETYLIAYVIDMIPHADEEGRLRPPFPIRE